MKSNRKRLWLYLSLGLVIVLIIATGIGIYIFLPRNGDAPTPAPTSADAYEEEQAHLESLASTVQFTEGNMIDAPRNVNNLGGTSAVYATLGIWTANKYVENAITNLYFVSGWWGVKDNYSEAAVNKYIAPYMTNELTQEYMTNLQVPGSPEFTNFYTPRVYLPDPNLKINPYCYDTWEKEACVTIAPPPGITDIVVTGVDKTTVKVDVKVNISAIYQSPTRAEGNLIIQPRTYNMSFILSEKNTLDDLNDTELPIMVIESISSSLEIQGNIDYITNSDS